MAVTRTRRPRVAVTDTTIPKPPPRRRIRRTLNAWWCPDDDRAMLIEPEPVPCDVCGKTPSDF